MKNYNVPINKGNYSMEPPEREELFGKYRSEGWEEEYKEYRKNWSEFPQKQHVNEYPLLVDLELSAVCNLTCPMCFTKTDEFKKLLVKEHLDFNLFKKIIDEIAGKVPAIRLSHRGEPTLNPNFVECIKYAKQKGIKEVSSLTNCSNLTEEFFEEIMLAGIDWLTISVDGMWDTYEKIRSPLKFEQTLEKIENAKKIKDKYGYHRPVIKIQSIWPAIKDNYEEFYDTFSPYADLIAFNPLIDYLRKDCDIIYEENFSCPQLYQRMIVSSSGKVVVCTNDENAHYVVGDLNNETVKEVWHSKNYKRIRETHKEKDGFKCFDMCKQCFIPRKMMDGESYKIQDREFIVKNYVNRKQIVGE